jgi:2'-5' RNA ligase
MSTATSTSIHIDAASEEFAEHITIQTTEQTTVNQVKTIKHQKPKPKPRPKPKPTHFLAIPLLSPSVTRAIQQVQASLIAYSPELQKACVEPETAHVTLCVTTLKDRDAIEAAKQVLLECKHRLESGGLSSPFSVELASLSDFRSSVLYLDIKGSNVDDNCEIEDEASQEANQKIAGRETLQAIQQVVEEAFQEAGIIQHTPSSSSSPLRNAFTPHLTIAKMSRMIDWSSNRGGRSRGRWGRGRWGRGRGRGTGRYDGDGDNDTKEEEVQVEGQGDQVPITIQHPLRKIPKEAYSQYVDIDAGRVECREIQLCAMNGRQPGQYYDVIERVVFGGD